MRVGLDLTPLQTPMSRQRGVGIYTQHLIQAMLSIDRLNDYVLFRNDFYPHPESLSLPVVGQYVTVELPLAKALLAHPEAIASEVKKIELLSEAFDTSVQNQSIDIFHVTSPVEASVLQLSNDRDIALVATVFDLIPLIYKNEYIERFTPPDREHYERVLASLPELDRLFAISTSVKQDLVEYLQIPEEKVDVVFAGVDKRFRVIESQDNFMRVRRTYGISGRFIMCPGGIDFRKNLERLLHAYSRMPSGLAADVQLAIVCRATEEDSRRLLGEAKRYGVPEDRVVMTGYVSDEDMVELYNAAECIVFPSLYEGFGLPIAETMACGRPVVTSNTSSMPEVAKDAAILFDPTEAAAIADAMERVLVDPALQARMINRGFDVVAEITWENVARKVLEGYRIARAEKVARRKKIIVGDSRIKKIAFLSPLPPMRSGISEYSEELLLGMTESFDIDVFQDGFDTDSRRLKEKKNISFKALTGFRDKADSYDHIVYQMGNSEFHIGIYEAALEVPGIVVLHDYVLVGMLFHAWIRENKPRLFADAHAQCNKFNHDLPPLSTWEAGVAAPEFYNYSFNERLVSAAQHVIVHNYWSMARLKKKIPDLPVSLVPMGVAVPAELGVGDKRSVRDELDIPNSGLVIGMFGMLTYTKRIEVVLRTMANLRSKAADCYLILVGKLQPPWEPLFPDVKKLITELGLDAVVRITDYVDFLTYHKYLGAVDVAVNLRYPTAGETSAALIRILAAGTPCITSAVQQYNEYPDDCCWKVDLAGEGEADLLTAYLEGLLESPRILEAMNSHAQEYARQNHTVERMVAGYRAVLQ